jgi:thioredoxin 1
MLSVDLVMWGCQERYAKIIPPLMNNTKIAHGNRNTLNCIIRRKPKMDNLTDATFDPAIKSGVVLVDFYADWCGPCKMMEPILTDISRSDGINGYVKFYKLNVDENAEVSKKYEVMSLPTVMIFKDGQEVRKIVGSVGGGVFLNELRKLVKL